MNKKRKFIVALVLILSLFFTQIAFARSHSSGRVNVKGYYRKDGTYVRPHTRSYPTTHGHESYSNDIKNEDYNNSLQISEAKKNELTNIENSLKAEEKDLLLKIKQLEKELEDFKKDENEINIIINDLEKNYGYVLNEKYEKICIYQEQFDLEKIYLNNEISSSSKTYVSIWESNLKTMQSNISKAKKGVQEKESGIKEAIQSVSNRKKKYIQIREQAVHKKEIIEYLNKSKQKYHKFKELASIPIEQKITVKFSKNIDPKTINSQIIKLISEEMSESVSLSFKILASNEIQIIPNKSLDSHKVYYLIINEGIKAQDGSSILSGTISKIIGK